jgi:hypothetical protein
MKHLTTTDLAAVTGGTHQSSQLTQSLTQIQSSISSLAQSTSNHGHSGCTPLLMAALLMNHQRSASTVVAAPGATAVVSNW